VVCDVTRYVLAAFAFYMSGRVCRRVFRRGVVVAISIVVGLALVFDGAISPTLSTLLTGTGSHLPPSHHS
jgi:O-antigen ligase